MLLGRSCSWAAPAPGPLPLLGRSRSWAVLSLVSLLSLLVFCLPQSVGAQGYPGGGGYPSSSAGYTVHCSGGSIGGKPLTPSDSPYPGSTGSTTGMKFAMAQPANGQPGQCGITASDGGTITGHITWNGGSANIPPPSAAIVMETSAATWSGTVGDSPDFVFTPDSTAGLGSGVTAVFSQNGQTYYPDGGSYPSSKSYTGVKYSAATSGSSSTTTCSPSFVLSGTTGINYDSYEYCSMMYTYTAQGFPITINLAGATPDSNGNLNILVGQGCTASLSGIPADLLPHTTYAWSVSDPSGTFQSWNGGGTTSPVVAILGLGPTNQPTAHWFWTDTAGLKTVTCNATVTPPSGQGSSFMLTVTQQVELQIPTYTANNMGGRGYIVQPPITVDYELEALPTPFMASHNYQEGSSWRVVMSIPTPFNSSGQYGYAQIIKPGEYYTGNDGIENPVSSDNGQQGLDTLFPYLGDIYSADNTTSNDGDSPAVRFGTDENLADSVAAVRLADVFQTYLMFKPSPGPGAPADDAQWVPLAESDWHTDMGAGRPTSGHWKDFPVLQGAGDVYVDADFFPQTVHPYWTRVSGH